MISFSDLVGQRTTTKQTWSVATSEGTPVISFTSLLKAEYKSSGKVVFEPIEENSFTAYNKTTEPREFYFELALQSPDNDFGAALDTLEELKTGTELFSFVTPFMAYEDLTLEGYSTVFESSSSMMVVGLQCKEVKEVEQGYTTVTVEEATPIGSGDAKNPDDVDTQDTGMGGTRDGNGQEKEKSTSVLRDWGIKIPKRG